MGKKLWPSFVEIVMKVTFCYIVAFFFCFPIQYGPYTPFMGSFSLRGVLICVVGGLDINGCVF